MGKHSRRVRNTLVICLSVIFLSFFIVLLRYEKNALQITLKAAQKFRPTLSQKSEQEGIFKVKEPLKLILWSHGGKANGNREHRQYEEAIEHHPYTTRTDSLEEADIILWITVRNRKEETGFEPYPNQSWGIILDYADTSSAHRLLRAVSYPTRYAAYMKRSWTTRPYRYKPGFHHVEQYPRTYPITYSSSRHFEREFRPHSERKYTILCTLRSSRNPSSRRNQVREFLKDYVEARGINDAILRPVSGGFHERQDQTFQDYNSHAKIIVTSNPDHWEGDSRTYEALATGALVFVDYTETFGLIPSPLKNGTHLFVYYHEDLDTLERLLDYYLVNDFERELIARAGYEHLLKYHRPENRLDYALSKALPYVKKHKGEPRNTIASHPYEIDKSSVSRHVGTHLVENQIEKDEFS